MKRGLAVLVLVAFCAGCTPLKQAPGATVLGSLRTIAVIPVEPPAPYVYRPLFGRSLGDELLKGAAMSPAGFPVVVVYAIYRAGEAMSKAAALPDGTLTVETDLPSGSGMPTMDLAKAAAATLQRHAGRTVYLVDGYLRLSGVERSQSPADVESDVRTRIIRWYKEDATRIDYSGLGLPGLDAILEVGILEYYPLQVMVRLVDPTTKQVLGRARDWKNPSLFPVPYSWTKGEPTDLITQCLKDLGLLAG
jgi:hypothetical protein